MVMLLWQGAGFRFVLLLMLLGTTFTAYTANKVFDLPGSLGRRRHERRRDEIHIFCGLLATCVLCEHVAD